MQPSSPEFSTMSESCFFLDVIPAEDGPLVESHSGIELVQLENEQFEINHQTVAVKLATAWQLPEPMMVAIGHHLQPENPIAHNDLTEEFQAAKQAFSNVGVHLDRTGHN
jgi:HD-like signal output (HDOD) protein